MKPGKLIPNKVDLPPSGYYVKYDVKIRHNGVGW